MIWGEWWRIARPGQRPGVGELSLMLIREAFRKSVAFVVVEEHLKDNSVVQKPKGTAFFVKVPISDQQSQTYAVTARHVVEAARATGSMWLRLNKRSGDFEDVPVDPNAWFPVGLDADKTFDNSDVSVMAYSPPQEYETSAFPLKWFLTPEESAKQEVGAGDDLFFVSLFTQHPGKARAEPIVRFGNVSLMPGELIELKHPSGMKTKVRGYLIEARSWGGNSGSPAFIYFPAHRHGGVWIQPVETPDGVMTDEAYNEATMPRLLGVVVGHFNLKQDVAFANDDSSEDLTVNSGMAVVVPADDLLTILMHPSLKEARAMSATNAESEEPAASADIAVEPEETSDEFDRFQDLARKLINTPKPSKDAE